MILKTFNAQKQTNKREKHTNKYQKRKKSQSANGDKHTNPNINQNLSHDLILLDITFYLDLAYIIQFSFVS